MKELFFSALRGALISLPVLSFVCLEHPNNVFIQDKVSASTLNESSLTQPKTSKVIVLIYDPRLTTRQNKRLSEYAGWKHYDEITNNLVKDFKVASGGFINYQIIERRVIDAFPPQLGGSINEQVYVEWLDAEIDWRAGRRTAPPSPPSLPNNLDYAASVNQLNVCNKVQQENLSEVWIWGAPYFGFDEFAFKLPGDQLPYPTNNYWFYEGRHKNLPDCGKTLWVMGWNYERGEAEALHSYGHRVESILSLTVGKGRWYDTVDPNNPWRRFSLIDKNNPGEAQVGSVHFPPNGQSDYDYGNPRFVSSGANDWLNYPNLTGAKQQLNCEQWGCNELGYMKWYLGHLSIAPGTSNGFHNNWWEYVANYDQRLESYTGWTFFDDVTGDGKADAVVVNNDKVTVRRSNGSSFSPSESWTQNPYYGTRGTFFIDVTGDGKADAVMVNNDKVTVRRSNGSSFDPNESWTQNPYYGTQGTFFVDVTGDGKADAVMVNDDKVTVRRSNGSSFDPNESWTQNPYHGTRGTFFVDVTGDGKADAVAVNDDKVTVRRSNGSSFSPSESWTQNPYYGTRGTFFVDVTGDGKADAVVVNNDKVTVRRSNGSSFDPNESWTQNPYYGGFGTFYR